MTDSVIPAASQEPLGDVFYSVDEAAQIVGLRPMTLWSYLSQHKIMRSKIGGTTRIRASELRKLIVDDPPPSPRAKQMATARAALVSQRTRKGKKATRKAARQ